jgi:peptidyl-prolyl cis-trans isomerase C
VHERLGAPRRLGRRILREPFLHFLLLGAALLASDHYLEERARLTHIRITKDQVRQIADNYRLQYGGLPSEHQLAALVDNFIKEEIFYREGAQADPG